MTCSDKSTRFSISMESELAQQLDRMISDKALENRSQTISMLVKDALLEYYAEDNSFEIAGSITLIFDHHQRQIQESLTHIQHDYGDLVISAMHVHLDHHNCMEILAVRGPVEQVRMMATQLIAINGVKHGKLTVTSTGKEFVK